MTDLPLTNHYGLAYSDAERENHRSLMPSEDIVQIVKVHVPETVASFALQNGIDALFLP